MTAAYNPDEIARLVREAREFLAILAKPLTGKGSATYAAERLGPVNSVIDRYSVMADQLEAARAEVDAKQRGYDDLHALLPGSGDIWSKVDRLLKRMAADKSRSMSIESAILRAERAETERDSLRAEIAKLRAELGHATAHDGNSLDRKQP